MAKDGNTYAKRQRETLKRQKAEAKRDRRKKRKDSPEATVAAFGDVEPVADVDQPPREV
jgi:hypothetical protein